MNTRMEVWGFNLLPYTEFIFPLNKHSFALIPHSKWFSFLVICHKFNQWPSWCEAVLLTTVTPYISAPDQFNLQQTSLYALERVMWIHTLDLFFQIITFCNHTAHLLLAFYCFNLPIPHDNACSSENQTSEYTMTQKPLSRCCLSLCFSVELHLSAVCFSEWCKQYRVPRMSKDVWSLAKAHNKIQKSESWIHLGDDEDTFSVCVCLCVQWCAT